MEADKEYSKEEKTLPHVMAVVDHLAAQGWKVKKSAVYNHRKEGKLHPQDDGSFRITDAERYAERYLKRKDGSESPKLENLQKKRLIAEISKTEAQAEHWANKAKASSGSFVPKEYHERDLARRAAVFRSDLETFARSEAPDIVNLFGGDAGKIPELVSWLLERFAGFLAAYAEEREFTIPLLSSIKEDSPDVNNEDDEEAEN